MPNDETERLLVEIGHLLAEDRAYPLEGTLLHAEVDRGMVAPSIFKDLGNHILYRWPDLDRLGDALLDLWEAQDGDDRWAEIEYLIRDGRFEVAYVYPDQIDPEGDWMEQREAVVRRYFGEKPIVFPPWPPPEDGVDYEL